MQRPRTTSLIILLALMPYGEDAHDAAGPDFKQGYVSSGAKGNDELSKE